MASQMFCHFLDLDNVALDTFINKSAERVAHINEQLHHLDQHISNLIELRSALLHRSNQLTSPIYIVPHEVLSYIFCFANELEQSITQPQKAMVLSAVSRRWRQVALSTPKLWERVECQCTWKQHRNTSLLIQHCALYASSLDISLFNQSDPDSGEETFDTTTAVLYSSNVTGKLKSLELLYGPPPQWIRLIPSFLRLEDLTIEGGRHHHPNVDLGSLPFLSRVHLSSAAFKSLILPPSVLMLHLEGQSTRHSVPLLYNCPRLVEFTSQSNSYSKSPRPISLSRPLVLDSLKTLVWSPAQTFVEVASATELKIPVIENLELGDSRGLELAPFITFCHQISPSLESLTLKYFRFTTCSIASLQNLFKFPNPTLRMLSLTDWSHTSILDAIRALTPGEEEDGYRNRCLPNLEYLSIGSFGSDYMPYPFDSKVVDLVKRRRIGEDSPFHFNFSFAWDDSGSQATWERGLIREFKEFVANRQMEVTVRGRKAELEDRLIRSPRLE
ncbi:hypothetical protein AGABI1DRAFT_130778 [Agaricus bisporus var. burnettii JB137-S8]|uniref:F-box domain-containing protein n=1 Tax=Agaricus bisporus var. burnettii (strain JB137-S8 / ATCC MYA-4627 / FGSC 10392) TaxID=597362 RepID=K5WNZ9_AGABU|nr:uncharacterized protein AGABI1DRAFT_130778 [Agaricus bisporus var. burnettii JB137-S8]EKM77051.1 hypothetical protein AGABI1DRAFT_130778 [Agaricus bisporus var. burnettii JB137-S8]